LEEQATANKKNIYFASDFHFGIPDHSRSLEREKLFVKWLDEVKDDAAHIFLMGDIFDFWFEYKTVIPKGFARLFGKLAEITDAGIPVSLFSGNHDDGLGPGDNGYKFLKKVFECRLCQWLFRWLHPDLGARMALYFSGKSRLSNVAKEGKKESSKGIENEMLYKYSKERLKSQPDIDYFIFGHRHLPTQVNLNDKTQLVILGDWITNFTYAIFDGKDLKLKQYGY
jgi:UDP-2,3-diacylglucosamine hydrolase